MARILVIDDDQDIATTTSLILKGDGHIVDIELDDKKALESIANVKPELIVLDVMFPGNSDAGFELSRSIRATYPTLPIIMVTSVNNFTSVKFSNKDKDANWLPIDEFVEKPIKKDVILPMVKRLIAK